MRDHVLNKSPNSNELSPKSPKRKFSLNEDLKEKETYQEIKEAIKENDVRKVKKFLRSWGEVTLTNDKDETFLMVAIAAAVNADFENLKMLQLLLDFYAQIDAKDSFGRTALWRAVYYRSTGYQKNDIIEFLVNNGADVCLASRGGISPISLAQTGGLIDVLEILKSSPTFLPEVPIDESDSK